MRALVTGATGFVGAAVARALLREGWQVRALVRGGSDRSNLQHLALEIAVGDLNDRPSLDGAVAGCGALFHVAADYRLGAPDPRQLYSTNVEGTRNILLAARHAGVERTVYTSSVATMGIPSDGSPGDEQTMVSLEAMIGHYKRSKWQAEAAVLAAAKSGLPAIVAMPTTPVGPWDWKPTPTGKIILDFLNGKMPGYVETGLNFVGVEDCAAGHLLVAERGKRGDRYLLGAENLTLKGLFDVLAGMTGLRAPALKIPHGLALGVAYVESAFSRLVGKEPQIPVEGVKIAQHTMFVDCLRAQRELGFQPGPVAAALERAVRWYQGNGYVSPRRVRKMRLAA